MSEEVDCVNANAKHEAAARRENLWTTIAIDRFRQNFPCDASGATARADRVLEAFDKAFAKDK